MADPRRLLEVGKIDKPHGVQGEVVVTLITNELERLAAGATLDLDGRELTVAWSKPLKHRFIVRFDQVATREVAEAVSGKVLRAPAVVGEPDAYWIHDLIGSEVVEPDGTSRGRVVEVLENPASDVLGLDTEFLVPLRFVAWDGPGRLVLIDAPDGLFDF